jgi:hypothetical protein
MISPTIPRIARAAINISPRKALSVLKKDRCQDGTLCEVVTSEILGDSDVPMGFLDADPTACPVACGSNMGFSSQVLLPLRPVLLSCRLEGEGKVAGHSRT